MSDVKDVAEQLPHNTKGTAFIELALAKITRPLAAARAIYPYWVTAVLRFKAPPNKDLGVRMQNNPEKPNTHANLRQSAEDRVRNGNAPETNVSGMGASSLKSLYQLASNPETAVDALKLLHELQVHQVELDLQYEHMIEASQALEQSVDRLTELFVLAPVAYFLVTYAGMIAEANLVGARMLGVERVDVGSQNIVQLAALDSCASLLALLEQVHSSGLRHSCRIQAHDTDSRRALEVVASASPDTQHCLVVVMEVSDPPSAIF